MKVRSRGTQSTKTLLVGAILLLTFAGAVVSPSHWTVAAAGLVLAMSITLLWRANDLPILLLPVAYQWTQVSVKPILSAIRQQPLNELSDYRADIDQAALFGLAGVAVLAIGLCLGAGSPARDNNVLLKQEAARWPLWRAVGAATAALALGYLLNAASGAFAPARQILLALAGVKYAGMFGLAYWCLVNRTGYPFLIALFGFDIIVGMTGFFAGFAGAVLILFVATLSARQRVSARDAIAFLMVASVMLSAAVFWSAVKRDYRGLLNGGTGAQVVDASLDSRFDYLSTAAKDVDQGVAAHGFQLLLARLSYIDFLSRTMEYVPARVDYTHGSRLRDSLIHVVTPRLLFPNKPALPNDSEVTAHYTGLNTTADPNTSISIGYLGEFYIDFGLVGALVATLALGLSVGSAYRLLRDRGKGSLLVRYGICAMAALSLATFEMAMIKLIGVVVTTYIAAFALAALVAPKFRILPRGSGGPRLDEQASNLGSP